MLKTILSSNWEQLPTSWVMTNILRELRKIGEIFSQNWAQSSCPAQTFERINGKFSHQREQSSCHTQLPTSTFPTDATDARTNLSVARLGGILSQIWLTCATFYWVGGILSNVWCQDIKDIFCMINRSNFLLGWFLHLWGDAVCGSLCLLQHLKRCTGSCNIQCSSAGEVDFSISEMQFAACAYCQLQRPVTRDKTSHQ